MLYVFVGVPGFVLVRVLVRMCVLVRVRVFVNVRVLVRVCVCAFVNSRHNRSGDIVLK